MKNTFILFLILFSSYFSIAKGWSIDEANKIITLTDENHWSSIQSTTFFDSNYLNFTTQDSCPDITSLITINSICGIQNGEASILSEGGTDSFSYQWSTGQTGEIINGLTEGAYTVTVTSDTCSVIENFNYDYEGDYQLLQINNYGGSREERISNVFPLDDGGWLLAGVSTSRDIDVMNPYSTSGSYKYDYWFVRLDSNRDIVWEKNYGGTGNDHHGKTIQVTNGNFVTVGQTSSTDEMISNPNGEDTAWVIEIDEEGNLIREKSFGGSDYDAFKTIVEMPNGDFVIAGSTNSIDGDLAEGNGDADFWVLRLDANWNILWSQQVGGSLSDRIRELKVAESGEIYVIGTTFSNDGDIVLSGQILSLPDVWFAKFSGVGDLVWQRRLGSSSSDFGTHIDLQNDTLTILMKAGKNDYNFIDEEAIVNKDQVWLGKYTTNGDSISMHKLIGNPEIHYHPLSLDTRQNGNHLVAAWVSYANPNLSPNDSYLLEVDNTGQIIDKYLLSFGANDIIRGVFPTNSDTLTGFGYGAPINGYGQNDYFLFDIKIGYSDYNIFATDTTACVGSELSFDFNEAQNQDYTYTWTDGTTDNPRVIEVTTDTLLTALITTPEGCQGLSKTQMNAYELETEETIYEIICHGGLGGASSSGIGGQFPYFYLWENGETTSLLNDIPAGDYPVTITDANNCIVLDTIQLQEPDSIFVNLDITQPTSGENNGFVSINISGGNPPFRVILDNEIVGNTIGGLPAGWYTVNIRDDDGFGCEVEVTFYLGESVSVKKLEEDIIQITPNPFSVFFSLNVNNNILPDAISIYNILGQQVLFDREEINDNVLRINTTNWISGTYFVEIKVGERSFVKKIVRSE